MSLAKRRSADVAAHKARDDKSKDHAVKGAVADRREIAVVADDPEQQDQS